jgi:uncharacterized membrane protein
MKFIELITKAGFYFLLPAIVVLNDSLSNMEAWEWNLQTMRGILIVPMIAGLTSLKAYFSSTYSKYQNGDSDKGKDPQG